MTAKENRVLKQNNITNFRGIMKAEKAYNMNSRRKLICMHTQIETLK